MPRVILTKEEQEKHDRIVERVRKARDGICPDCGAKLDRVSADKLPPFVNGVSIYKGFDGFVGLKCFAKGCEYSAVT